MGNPTSAAGGRLPASRAIEILDSLVAEAKLLEAEPFGSPRRDQWTMTARGALEQSFGSDSSVVRSFQTAQSIVFKRGDSPEALRRVDNEKLAFEISVLESAARQLKWASDGERERATSDHASAAPIGVTIFVSHSSKDQTLAKALVALLKSALALPADQIRCSSVDGHRLPVGANTESTLREEVNAAKILIGLVTPSSLASHFVMFELGARWGGKLFMAPLLCGVAPHELKDPLRLLNSLLATERPQLLQLVDDIARELKIKPQSAAVYSGEIDALVRQARAVTSARAPEIVGLEQSVASLKRENETLSSENASLREQLRFRAVITRINGHTYIDGDDAEMCANCLAVRSMAVPLQDMNLDRQGRKATCPNCKMPRGNGPPIPRHRAEEVARKKAAETE
jgi:hypothetical protein